jgi:SH3-like domain-containing protein
MGNSSGSYLPDLRGRWHSGSVSREQALHELSGWEDDLANRTDEELEAAWALRREIEGHADIVPGAVAANDVQPLPNQPIDAVPGPAAQRDYSTLPPQAAEQWEQPLTSPRPTPQNPPIPPPIPPPALRITNPDAPTLQMRVPSQDSPAFNERPGSGGMWPGTVSVPPTGDPSYIDRLFDQALAAYQVGQLAGANELLAEVARQQPGYSRNGQSTSALLAETNRLLGRTPSQTTSGYNPTVTTTTPQPDAREVGRNLTPASRSWAPWAAIVLLLALIGGGALMWNMGIFGGRDSGNLVSGETTATAVAHGGATSTKGPTRTDARATATPSGSGLVDSPTVEPTSTVPAPPPPTDTVTPVPIVSASTNDINIALREGPGEEYGILAFYTSNTFVYVLALNQSGDWARVSIDGDGREGWIMSRHLNFAGDTSSLPIESEPGAGVSRADAVVNNADVRLCEGPGYSFAVITQYDTGSPMRVLAKNSSENWLRVEMMMPGRTTGWVEKQWLRVLVDLQSIPVEGGPTQPGKVTLDDDRFVGGCAEGCRAVREYNGSTATWIYGGNRYTTMAATFDITSAPSGGATLTIRGLDSEGSDKTPLRILVNNYIVYDGNSPFPDDDVEGPGGPPTWGSSVWSFDASILREGQNSVAIYNLSSTGKVGKPPFFMLDYAEVEWGR